MKRCVKLIVEFQYRQESFLRNFYVSDLAHTFLTFFLLLEQLTLTADITAITFCSNIFTHRADVFTRYYFSANSSLYSYLELLPWKQLLQFFAKLSAEFV